MFRNFWKNENGQGMVEYSLIIALIAVVAIVAVTAIGKAAKDKLQAAADALEDGE